MLLSDGRTCCFQQVCHLLAVLDVADAGSDVIVTELSAPSLRGRAILDLQPGGIDQRAQLAFMDLGPQQIAARKAGGEEE